MPAISSGAGRRDSGVRRFSYQVVAEVPELVQGDGGPPLDALSLAPAIDGLFRPEEEHRLSGVDDVVPPSRWRDREVDRARARNRFPAADFQL